MLKNLIGILGVGLLITTVNANTIKIYDTPYDGGSNGGEFKAVTDVFGTYITFCLERSENLSFGTAYDFNVNTDAVAGGNDHDPDADDTISAGTVWLYEQFRAGTLDPNYALDEATHIANGGKLQNAIWFLEDELAFPGAGANSYLDAAIAANGGTFALAQADANFANTKVRALNLYNTGHLGDPAYKRQDVLVLLPDGGLALALMGFALVGIEGLRRRFVR